MTVGGDGSGRPILVVGSPRSGTTVLQLLLNAHSELAIAGELHFWDAVLAKWPDADVDSIVPLSELVEQIAGNPYSDAIPDVEELASSVDAAFGHQRSVSTAGGYRTLLDVIRERAGASRSGEKTPTNVRYLKELTAACPDAQVIHIVRDPRAAVASRLRVAWSTDDVVLNALKWRSHVLAARRAGERMGIEQYCEIRYEDLVTDPESVLTAVCSFLDVDYEPDMLLYHRSSDREVELSREPWKGAVQDPVSASSVDAWTASLGPAQVRLIEAVGGDLMKSYGYAPHDSSARLSAPAMLVAIASDARAFLRSRSAARGGLDAAARRKPNEGVVRLMLLSAIGRTPHVPAPLGAGSSRA